MLDRIYDYKYLEQYIGSDHPVWGLDKAIMDLWLFEIDGLLIEVNSKRYEPMIVWKGNKWINVRA